VAAQVVQWVEGTAPDNSSAPEGEDHGAEEGVDEEGGADGQSEHIEDGNASEMTRGVAVGEGDHGERDDAGAADGPGGEESDKGREEKESQSEDAGHQGGGAKSENGEEIFGKVVGHAECTGGPVDADQIPAEDDVLAKAAMLDFESEAEVFEDFHAERFETADGAIGAAAYEIEGTDADGIMFCGWVGGFPGAEREQGEATDDGGHESLSGSVEDQGEREGDVIGLRFVGEAEGTLEGVLAEENVAVGEEQPWGCGLASSEGHSVGLAHPAFREVVDVEDGEGFARSLNFEGSRFGGDLGGKGIHEGTGLVGGAVIDGDDFDGDGLVKEGTEGGIDAGGFIAGGDDDGDLGHIPTLVAPKGGVRRGWGTRSMGHRVVARVEEIGDTGQMVEGG